MLAVLPVLPVPSALVCRCIRKTATGRVLDGVAPGLCWPDPG
jgi:hypothetical protein